MVSTSSTSIIEDAVMDLACTVHNVCIDSRSRDTAVYPNTFAYVIPLTDTLQNVMDIELTYAQYSVDSEASPFGPSPSYIILSIDECTPNNFAATSPALAGAYTILPLSRAASLSSSLIEYTRDMYRSIKRFPAPKAKLSRMTISFRAPDGSPLTSLSDHLLRFEVRSAPVVSPLSGNTQRRHTEEVLSSVLPKLNRRLRALEASLDVALRRADSAGIASANTKESEQKDAVIFEQSSSQSATTIETIKRAVIVASVAAAGYAGYRFASCRRALHG
jgi:hypothetical protein